MFKRGHSFYLLLLLIFSFNGCVVIPSKIQLVDMDMEQGLVQVQKHCIYDSPASAIKVNTELGRELDASHISLLNWNIYKGQRSNWASDFSKFIQHHDIVILQEAVLVKELYQALNRQALNWSLNTAFYYDDAEAGVLSASKVRALRRCGLRSEEPLIKIPKTMLITEYPLSDGLPNLLVANIHAINFTIGTEAYELQIDLLTDAIAHHDGPVIVAGDFNTWSDRRMSIVERMAERLSLNAVTYKNHNRLTIFGNPLDHVFYKGLKLIAEENPRVSSSDHNPISVIFSVSPAQLVRI